MKTKVTTIWMRIIPGATALGQRTNEMTTTFETTPNYCRFNANQNQRKLTKNDKFKVMLWNCNRLVNKSYLFSQFVKKQRLDIVAISELKCNSAEANECLNEFGDYSAAFCARNPEKGDPSKGGAQRYSGIKICRANQSTWKNSKKKRKES
jgi:hypothetical protein